MEVQRGDNVKRRRRRGRGKEDDEGREPIKTGDNHEEHGGEQSGGVGGWEVREGEKIVTESVTHGD